VGNGVPAAGPTGGQLGKRPLGDGEDAVEGGAFKEVSRGEVERGRVAVHPIS
jgi:hypothetical protein